MNASGHARGLAAALLAWGLAGSGGPALGAEAPRVLRTTPADGDEQVDPGMGELRIEFDQDMRPDSYSVVGGGSNFPKPTGQPRWQGARLFTLPVVLEPDHAYEFGVNSERHHGFCAVDGTPAVPVRVRFHTAGSAQQPPAGSAKAALALLRAGIDECYAYRDRLGLDWAARFAAQESALLAAPTPRAFAEAAVTLLAPARDPHLWLEVDGERLPTYERAVRGNFDLVGIRKSVPEFKQLARAVFTGRWPDGTGYLLLGALDAERTPLAQVHAALASFAEAPALIVDLRANGGGDEELAQEIAGCFVDAPVVYARHRLCGPEYADRFSAPMERVLAPAAAGLPLPRGKLAILQGRFTLSSAEAFVLMLKQVPGAVTIGDTTGGSSGNPKPLALGNGVTVFLPSWEAMDAAGRPLEGVGIPPDLLVAADHEALRAGDPIIERAIARLTKE